MRRIHLLLCLLIGAASGADTQVGVWKNYASMRDVRSVAGDGGLVWAASSGGLFQWNPASGAFLTMTNAEGMLNSDLTAVGIDQRGRVWVGTSAGHVQVYSPASGRWRHVTDLAEENQTDRRIRSFSASNDTMYVSTGFGLSVIHGEDLRFGDTYRAFGAAPATVSGNVSSSTVFNNRLWVAVTSATGTGYVAFGDLLNPNLLPPSAWSLMSVAPGNPLVTALSIFNSTLYASTTTGLYFLENGAWVQVAGLAGRNIVTMRSADSRIVVCTTEPKAYTVDAQHLVAEVGTVLPYLPTSIMDHPQLGVVIGTTRGGLLAFNSTWTSHLPNGPASTEFPSIAVDQDGTVWCATGSANASGISRFDGKHWRVFTTNDGLPTNDYYRVAIGCNGSVWASSWGRGILEIPYGSNSIDTSRIFGTNVGMQGAAGDVNFVVPSTVVCDRAGNVWVSPRNPSNGNSLAVRRPDGSWFLTPAIIRGSIERFLYDAAVQRTFAVDASDNIWATVRGANSGVARFTNRPQPNGSAAYHLTSDDGLSSGEINTIVVDRENDVWVGTSSGISVILDPDNPRRAGAIASYRPLPSEFINTIAVDALNRKWVGTSKGAYLLSRDGTQILASYTVENTDGKLIADDIKCIDIDGKTGTVYFASLSGLASLTTTAVEPVQVFGGLVLSPNPFLIPASVHLAIDGLVANSSIKVLSSGGAVVRDIVTPGGRIGFWDGRDNDGKDVASGIYIIVAYSEDGSSVATGKVAVIRR